MSNEQELLQAIRKLNDKIDNLGSAGSRYSGNARPSANTDSGVTANLDNLLKVLGGGLKGGIEIVGELAGKASDNTATVQDATSAVSGVIKQIGGVGQLFGKGMDGVVDILVQSVENWQKFSNFGLQFGGNSLALNNAVKKTGLSFNEYSELIERATPGFANFGEGLSRGAEQFGEASEQFRMKYGKELSMLGMTTKDVNNALALTIRGAGMIDAKNEQQMTALLASAGQLAKEMDAMAKLTGTSRKEQEKNIETMQNDVRVRARIVEMRKTDPSGQIEKSINSTIEAGSGLGQASQKALLESIAGKGIMTTEKASELQEVYGTKYVNMIKEIGRLTSSQNAEDRKEAQEMTKRLYLEQVEGRKSSSALIPFFDKMTSAMEEGFGADQNGIRRVDVLEANLANYMKDGMTKEQAYAAAYKDATELGKGNAVGDVKDKDGKTIVKAGEKDPRSALTEMVTGATTQIKLFGGSISSLVSELNNTVTLQKKKNTNEFVFDDALNMVGGRTKTKAGNVVKDYENDAKQGIYNTANPTAQANYQSNLNRIIAEEVKKALAKQKNTTVPDMSNIVPAGQSDPTRAPNLNGVLKNVPSKVSDDSKATTPKTEEKVPETGKAQDPMLEKLSEISTIMQRVEQNTASTATHVKDTASNTRDMGGYIS